MKANKSFTEAFRNVQECAICKKERPHSLWKDETAGTEELAAYFSICIRCTQIEPLEKETFEKIRSDQAEQLKTEVYSKNQGGKTE